MSRFCPKLLLPVVALIGVAALCFTRTYWLPVMHAWLDVGEVPRRVDFVLALPGDEQYRPFQAAAMINAGLANGALIVQNVATASELDGVSLPTSEIVELVYRHCQIPNSKVTVLKGKSGSTADDIDILSEFFAQHPQATIAIVTSDYHTRRARWMLQNRLGNRSERMMIVSSPNGYFDRSCWWETEQGFQLVIMEYIKLIGYLFIYSNWIKWLGAILCGCWLAWHLKPVTPNKTT